VLVLVDAAEGPMPQTKFVVARHCGGGAADRRHQQGRSPDGPGRSGAHESSTFSRCSTPTSISSISDPVASGRNGWAVAELTRRTKDLAPLFDLIVAHVRRRRPIPTRHSRCGDELDYDPYLGRVLRGSHSGVARLHAGQIAARDGRVIERPRYQALAYAAWSGLEWRSRLATSSRRWPAETTVADTLCALEVS